MSEEEKKVQESEEVIADDATVIEPEAETAETQEETKAEPNEEIKEESGADKSEEKKEDSDLNDKYMRLMAEYQNYRTRTAKEKTDIYAHANEKFAGELLSVIDNFERAMAAKAENDKFAEGMELILKQLLDVLTKNGVSEIEALGKPFDPNFHNAVMTEDAGEGVESGTITKVLQKGYVLNSKVIRPAMVAVAQ